MTIDQSTQHTGEFPAFDEGGLNCTNCLTKKHLIIEAINPPESRTAGLVAIEYSCGKCEAYFAHEARVESVAKLLGKSHSGTGVLQFGAHYIHCGEPMSRGRLKLTTLKVTDGDLVDAPGVAIPTTVLLCRCGFQMAIPISHTG